MSLMEAEWVARFVANGGGSEADGQATYRKMQSQRSQDASSLLKPAVSAPHPTSKTTPEEPDLFAGTPELEQAPPPATSPSQKSKLPVKRGRKPAALDAKPPTQRELDLFHLSMEIEQRNAKESGDLGYLATAMIHASLPHSKIEGGVFKRRNGPISLTILNDPDIGLPYGKLPRIITAFICTQAKLFRDKYGPVIYLGKSQNDFMTKLGLQSTGGDRGDIRRLHDQAKRLFTSTITLIGEPGSEFHWKKVNISNQGMLLWNPHNFHQESKWQTTLTLSEEFYQECINHPVPIDLRVLHKMRSPLAIDIYIWLTYRYNVIKEPTPISWKQLKWQFGSNYPDTQQGEWDFKANFRKQLRAVLAFYREAKLDARQDCLVLLPSKPHVLPEIS